MGSQAGAWEPADSSYSCSSPSYACPPPCSPTPQRRWVRPPAVSKSTKPARRPTRYRSPYRPERQAWPLPYRSITTAKAATARWVWAGPWAVCPPSPAALQAMRKTASKAASHRRQRPFLLGRATLGAGRRNLWRGRGGIPHRNRKLHPCRLLRLGRQPVRHKS